MCACVVLWAAAGAAQGADIFVPQDAPTLEAAVALAEDGDTIVVVDEELITDVAFSDLGGKAITVFAGVRPNRSAFYTAEESLWIMPDGSRFVGDDIRLVGSVRVRDGANAIIDAGFDNGFVEIGQNGENFLASLEIGEDASLDLLAELTEVSGRVRLREGAELHEYGGGFSVDGPGSFLLSEQSRLNASGLDFGSSTSLIATNAEIETFNFRVTGDSYIEMNGGRLTTNLLMMEDPFARLSLEDASLTILGDSSLSSTRLWSGTSVRGGSVSSLTELIVDAESDNGPQSPGNPIFENTRITAPQVWFDGHSGETRISGEVFGGVYVDAPLLVLGDLSFYGFVENSATITVLGGELSFLGGLENFGSIVAVENESRGAAPRSVRVLGDLTVFPGNTITLGAGDRLAVRGDLAIRTEAAGVGLAGAAVEILPTPFDPTGFDGEYVEAVGADLGASERGFDVGRPDAAPFGGLIMRNGVEALVADWIPNVEGAGALYVETVRVDVGGTLRVAEDTRVYCRTLIADGVIESPERVVLVGTCEADLAAPFGTIDLADITAYVTGFGDQLPRGDFAEPYGVFDLADISDFVSAFVVGCP